MATTYEFKPKVVFADTTSKTYSLPLYLSDEADTSQIPARAQEINRVLGGESSSIEAANEYAAAMRQTFVSTDGAQMSQIVSAKLIATEETVVYSG